VRVVVVRLMLHLLHSIMHVDAQHYSGACVVSLLSGFSSCLCCVGTTLKLLHCLKSAPKFAIYEDCALSSFTRR
jgi:hypothetical protein